MGVLTAAKARKLAAVPDAAEKLHLSELGDNVYVRPLTGLLVTRLGYATTQGDEDEGTWVAFFPEILHACVFEDKECERRVYPTMADAEAACDRVSNMTIVITMCSKAMELTNLTVAGLEEVEGN
jgi:hypothetical protein